MKIRRIVSLTAFLAFILLILTSVILYIVPQGRIAYWSNWRLWGLSKTQWGDLHINLGVLFLIAILLHIYYNWKPVLNYLKTRAGQLKVFTPEFNAALACTLIVVAGTWLEVPPFSSILELNAHFQDTAAQKYGEPPYGHAELSSLKTFCSKMGLDPKESLNKLQAAGLAVKDQNQTLLEIGKANNLSPLQVYQLMAPIGQKEKSGDAQDGLKEVKIMPPSPSKGFGKRTLADISHEYSLNIPKILASLKENGMSAKAGQSLREIAENNKRSPVDVYEVILQSGK